MSVFSVSQIPGRDTRWRASTTEALKVLITGFYDWEDSLGLPAFQAQTTLINPSGHLLLGTYPGKLDSLLQGVTGKAGRQIQWTFKVLETVQDAASTLNLEEYDIFIGLGLGSYEQDDIVRLEKNALNEFEGMDAKEGAELYQAATEVTAQLTAANDSAQSALKALIRVAFDNDLFNDALLKILSSKAQTPTREAAARLETARTRAATLVSRIPRHWVGGLSVPPDIMTYITDAKAALYLAMASVQELRKHVLNLLQQRFQQHLEKNLEYPQKKQQPFLGRPFQLQQATSGNALSAALEASFSLAAALVATQVAESRLGEASTLATQSGKSPLDPAKKKIFRPRSLRIALNRMSVKRRYGPYTLKITKPDPDNDYVCNATHAYAIQIVRQRRQINSRLREAYFIHLPFSCESQGWHEHIARDEPNYHHLQPKPANALEGYKVLSNAVAGIIKDLVS
jgi:hypothetical protein